MYSPIPSNIPQKLTPSPALADALNHLGITPVYHMREVAPNAHQDLWIRAISDNLPPSSPPRPWTREQWDLLLPPYAAVSDFPPALFATALAAAYPDCPIILSTRPFEAWAASMRDTLIHGHLNRDPGRVSPMAGLAAAYHAACWGDDFEGNGRGYFERHHEEVRALAGEGRRVLEYRPGDGWGPLCEFLGVDVPDVPFPRSDDWVEYKKMVERERAEKARQGAEVTAGSN
ncbi:hypothetical protein CkaCkLH20_11880 [Colletotrichum karsti]|uniref:Uncharacterized protein n=1 Tax=Colletotrichum karsti TaxID=1095194 RepID=A0A9P6HUG7_9PEZI|nr:uncharacterized protein CkaCkLH20_11880 [Colletotrichum karsti]KAF9870574.1 hypothetical protein CkaCkLH20_11880 [Colletotrichum karsti]